MMRENKKCLVNIHLKKNNQKNPDFFLGVYVYVCMDVCVCDV